MDGSIRIGTELDEKKFDKQIAELEKKLEIMINTLKSEADIPVSVRMSNAEKSKLESDIEKTKNQILSLRREQAKLNSGNGKSLKDGFESAFKSAKKLAISILGIRTAFSLVNKATSAYLATDSKTTAQMEANWVGLGAIMGPVIQYISNLMKKAVTSVLYFMSALTGTNYIAKANESILKKQAKATNDLAKANNKYTASFDEMNIFNPDTGSGSSVADDVMASLFDINDISETTRSAIEKVADALKPVYKIIKDIIGWGLEHPDVLLGIIGGTALLSMLGKIIGYAGAGTAIGTGLAGILGVLLAIASVSIIAGSALDIINHMNEYKEEQEGAIETLEGVAEQTEEYRQKVKELSKDEERGAEVVKQSANAYKTFNQASADHVKVLVEEGVQTKGFNKFINDQIGRTEALGKQIKIETNEMFKNAIALSESYKAGKLDEQGKKDYFDTLASLTDITELATLSTDELSNKFLISKKDAELLKTQYDIVATELYRMYKNGDITVDILDKMPKEVRTQMENNFDKNLELLDNVYSTLEKLPIFKQIDVETKVTADTSSAKSSLDKLFSGMTSGLATIDKVLGTNFSTSFSKIKFGATGGIINNPGRGVPIVSNIYGGEAGQEGLIPLTDPNAMQELGYSIGKWVNVNTTNNILVNGRLLQRQVNQSQADRDFATNGRG